MRKIKSVKLKNDYRSSVSWRLKGTELKLEETEEDGRVWVLNDFHKFTELNVRNNQTDLFEIEYEEERKKIIIEIENDLQDWTAEDIQRMISQSLLWKGNLKVTEYNEGNFIDFGQYVLDHPEYLVINAYKNWVSERSNK